MFNFRKQAGKIEGWLTEKEGNFLYEIAKKIPKDKHIIEIGSWKGRSTICLGHGVKDGNKTKIYAIDPHTGSSEHHFWMGKVNTYKDFLKNIENSGIGDFIIPIKDTSENTARNFDKPIGFVFVDGAHEFRFVRLDHKLWFPKLSDGCKIVFHDCWHAPGVNVFTSMLLVASSKIKNPKLIDTMTVFDKVEKNTLTDRFKNICFLFYRFFLGWTGWIKMNFFGGTVLD